LEAQSGEGWGGQELHRTIDNLFKNPPPFVKKARKKKAQTKTRFFIYIKKGQEQKQA